MKSNYPWKPRNWQDIAAIATSVLCLLTFITLIYVAKNYFKFVEDIELRHEPVVFIKEVIIPEEQENDPFEHIFVITNAGQLPAKDVSINCLVRQRGKAQIIVQSTEELKILKGACIYPNNDLTFWLPHEISLGKIPAEAEVIFKINYKSEASEQEISQIMKFVYSEKTDYCWNYVGPEIDIFTNNN